MSAVTFAIPDGRGDLLAILLGVAEENGQHCELRRGTNGNTLVSLDLNPDVARATDAAMAAANSRLVGLSAAQ